MAGLAIEKSLYCRSCLHRLIRHTPLVRTFTTSSARQKHGALPTFAPTSSPDLDALLATFRANVFLPAHLSSLQKSLVYRQRNHRLLTNPDEPATVKLGNEVHQLHPLDRLKDEPRSSKALAQIVDLCKEGRDWAQLVAFFEGLRDAGRRVKGKQVEMVVRRCCDAGRGGVVVEMLQRVERTGVRLGDLAVCREVMRGLGVERAVQGAFGEEAVGEAARWVEGAWVMLSEERHVDQGTRKVHGDPKIVPDVVGIVLWARALRSMLLDGMKDEDGKVKRGAEMLLAVWQRFEPESDEVKDDWRRHQNNNLIMWTPVWHGMKMARKILGETTPLGRDLRTVMTRDLEPLLENASKVVSENSKENGGVRRRGLTVYNELSKIATEESSTPTVDSAE